MKRALLLVIVMLATSQVACSGLVEGGGVLDSVLSALAPSHQRRSAEIIDEFAKSPSAAKAKYRKVWDAEGRSGKGRQSVDDQVAQLTIASQLLAVDQANAPAYLGYAKSLSSSADDYVAGMAMQVLGRGNDPESLNVLLDGLLNARLEIAGDALMALQYRYSVRLEGGNQDSATFDAFLAMHCGRPPNPDVTEFCRWAQARVPPKGR